jgi:hypothetical protein
MEFRKTTSSGTGQNSLAMPENRTWEYWSIGIKIEDYDIFVFFVFSITPSLHYSIIPERP